jgi:membrane protease YdiL (CAAX protease family)
VIVVFGIVNPLIEEVVFRFGVLSVIRDRTGSDAAAVAGSALLFSAVHFGPSFQFTPVLAAHGVLLFIFALLLGTITTRRYGRIGMAVAAHVGRNLAEQVLLFAAVA